VKVIGDKILVLSEEDVTRFFNNNKVIESGPLGKYRFNFYFENGQSLSIFAADDGRLHAELVNYRGKVKCTEKVKSKLIKR